MNMITEIFRQHTELAVFLTLALDFLSENLGSDLSGLEKCWGPLLLV